MGSVKRQLKLWPLILLAAAAVALADDFWEQGVGGAIQPASGNPNISLDEMTVTVRIDPGAASVHGIFLLRNHGPATTVPIGVPESGNDYGPNPDISQGIPGFTAFRMSVDGKVVRSEIRGLECGPNMTWWRLRVAAVSFAAGQVRRVEAEYNAPLGSCSNRYFRYRMRTAAPWAGPVSKALLRVVTTPPPRGGRYEFPPSFRAVGRNEYEWTATNLEPASDDTIEVRYWPPGVRPPGRLGCGCAL